jgi:hypothetical protein
MRYPVFRIGSFVMAIVLTLTLSGSTAFAFECYNASRSAKGNAAAAKSPALVSAHEALTEFCGLTDEQAAGVIDELANQGFKTDFLINFRALMAGGLEKNGKGGELLHNGKGIDHLSGEFFGALIELAPSCGEE